LWPKAANHPSHLARPESRRGWRDVLGLQSRGHAHSDRHEVPLTNADIPLIIEALDSHEYWQLSEPTWRHSGAVILPSDDELLWARRPAPNAEEQEAISAIERCRELADRLRLLALEELRASGPARVDP
jgi:hypothetical protein